MLVIRSGDVVDNYWPHFICFQVIIQYTSGERKIQVISIIVPLVKAIGYSSIADSGPFPYLAKVIFGTINLSPEVFKESCNVVTGEIQNICSSLSPSIHWKKSKTDLQNFSWDSVFLVSTNVPSLLPVSAPYNPSAVGNKVKTHLQIRNAMCSAGCKLLSIFDT